MYQYHSCSGDSRSPLVIPQRWQWWQFRDYHWSSLNSEKMHHLCQNLSHFFFCTSSIRCEPTYFKPESSRLEKPLAWSKTHCCVLSVYPLSSFPYHILVDKYSYHTHTHFTDVRSEAQESQLGHIQVKSRTGTLPDASWLHSVFWGHLEYNVFHNIQVKRHQNTEMRHGCSAILQSNK